MRLGNAEAVVALCIDEGQVGCLHLCVMLHFVFLLKLTPACGSPDPDVCGRNQGQKKNFERNNAYNQEYQATAASMIEKVEHHDHRSSLTISRCWAEQ